jgi:hypothetical protein
MLFTKSVNAFQGDALNNASQLGWIGASRELLRPLRVMPRVVRGAGVLNAERNPNSPGARQRDEKGDDGALGSRR